MTILPEARQFLLSRFTKNNAYFDTEKKTLNEPFPLHYHNYFEIELIFKGHGTEYINQHKIDIKPGLMYSVDIQTLPQFSRISGLCAFMCAR